MAIQRRGASQWGAGRTDSQGITLPIPVMPDGKSLDGRPQEGPPAPRASTPREDPWVAQRAAGRASEALLNQPKGGLTPEQQTQHLGPRSDFGINPNSIEAMQMSKSQRSLLASNRTTWRDEQPDFSSQAMFLSAREIMGTHAPLDADREMVEDPDADPVISFSRTYGAQAGTDSSLPGTRTGLRQALDQFDQQGFAKQHTHHGKTVYVESGERIETADEVYDRKRDEADSDWDSRGVSLYESVAEEGVRRPIHLATEQFTAMTPEGEELPPGEKGRPVIVGGHHRLAVAAAEDPDRLIPVLRHKDIQHAKRSEEFPYS